MDTWSSLTVVLSDHFSCPQTVEVTVSQKKSSFLKITTHLLFILHYAAEEVGQVSTLLDSKLTPSPNQIH